MLKIIVTNLLERLSKMHYNPAVSGRQQRFSKVNEFGEPFVVKNIFCSDLIYSPFRQKLSYNLFQAVKTLINKLAYDLFKFI